MSEYKVIVLGPTGVGKTALVEMYIRQVFSETSDPSFEDSYRKEEFINGERCILDILDTAGSEEYSAMRDPYLRTGQCFLLVYSVTYRQTFEEMRSFYDKVLRVKDEDRFPMVLVGNKMDKEEDREVQLEEGIALATEWKIPFLETSACKNMNVKEVFQIAVVEIQQRCSVPSCPTPKNNKCCLM